MEPVNRLATLYVVLEEQNRQYRLGVYDPDMLASLTASATHHCQKEAIMMGIDDAQQLAQDEAATALGEHENLVCRILLDPSKWFKAQQASNQPIFFTCL